MNRKTRSILRRVLFILLATLIPATPGNSTDTEGETTNDTVILLHGLGRTSRSMADIAEYLTMRGYRVKNVNYPSSRFSIAELSVRYLKPVIEQSQKQGEKIHFVTHSMGGILVRHYLANHQEAAVGRVVMLAPPNQGSEIIDILAEYQLFQYGLGPAAQQLSTRPDSLANSLPPVSSAIGIIAGNSSFNPLLSLLIPGNDDGKVSVKNTTLIEMHDHIILNVSHTFIMKDPEVLEQVDHFLQFGSFDHQGSNVH